MPKQGLTEIVAIIDRSGSMYAVLEDMEGGFNAFLDEQRALDGECVITLVQFDAMAKKPRIETVYEEKPIKEVPVFRLMPRGDTPLNDAIGRTILTVGNRLSDKSEEQRPEKVIVMIVTDGLENASVEFTRDHVKKMVEHQTNAYAWQFTFLGANIDAIKEASSIGVLASSAMQYSADSAGVAGVFRGASTAVSRARGGETLAYNDDERKGATSEVK